MLILAGVELNYNKISTRLRHNMVLDWVVVIATGFLAKQSSELKSCAAQRVKRLQYCVSKQINISPATSCANVAQQGSTIWEYIRSPARTSHTRLELQVETTFPFNGNKPCDVWRSDWDRRPGRHQQSAGWPSLLATGRKLLRHTDHRVCALSHMASRIRTRHLELSLE